MRTRARIGLLAACLTVGGGFTMSRADSGYWVEFDLDSTFGNGPDSIEAVVSDIVSCDLWISGPRPLLGFSVVSCNPDMALDYLDLMFHLPGGWSIVPNLYTPPCCAVQATDFFGLEPISLPFRVATIRFEAALPECLADLTMDVGSWIDENWQGGLIDGFTGATIRITGPTTAGPTTWGAIKEMFR